jgi:hypothetical protein
MKIIQNNLKKVFLIFAITLCFFYACSENDKTNNKYSYSEDGMLQIDGERLFIIGSYYKPKTDNPFKELKDNGYNYVRVSPNEADLDSAFSYGLNTWLSTGSIKESKNDDIIRITNLVNKFKQHKSLLFWEMEDEPAFVWNSADPRIKPEPLLETYQLIKKLDKEHLVITNHGPVNLISTLQKYNNTTDVVACDVYPVIPHGIKPAFAIYPDGLQGDLLNPYISQVGEYVDKMKKVVHDSKPVFMVLQGFSWEMLKAEELRDPSKILYPTYEESRFMAYNSIVHGANGILYWGTSYTPQPSPFISDLNKVTRELAEYQNILSSPNQNMDIKKEYHELRYSVDAGIEFIVKIVNEKTYLITVNSDKNPIKISFSGLSGFSSVKVLKEKRSIEITENKLTDYYEPFGVHIYELNK